MQEASELLVDTSFFPCMSGSEDDEGYTPKLPSEDLISSASLSYIDPKLEISTQTKAHNIDCVTD